MIWSAEDCCKLFGQEVVVSGGLMFFFEGQIPGCFPNCVYKLCQEYPKITLPKNVPEFWTYLYLEDPGIWRHTKTPWKWKVFFNLQNGSSEDDCQFSSVYQQKNYQISDTLFFLNVFFKGIFQDGIQREWVSIESHSQPVLAGEAELYKTLGCSMHGFFWFHFLRGTESPGLNFQLRKINTTCLHNSRVFGTKTHNYISESGNARAWGDGVRYRYML